MSNYETVIKLPGGHLYSDHPEFAEPITLSMLTTKDEKKIFGSSTDEAFRSVIKSITSPSIDINELTVQDRLFLFIEMRKHTYGTNYHVVDECEHCHTTSEFKVDLADLELINPEEELSREFDITLPISKDELTIKLLTYGDSLKNRKRAARVSKEIGTPISELEFSYNLESMIVKVNGEELESPKKTKYVNELVGMDSAFISHSIKQRNYGYSNHMIATCPSCGSDTTVDFELNSEFFRPRFD